MELEIMDETDRKWWTMGKMSRDMMGRQINNNVTSKRMNSCILLAVKFKLFQEKDIYIASLSWWCWRSENASVCSKYWSSTTHLAWGGTFSFAFPQRWDENTQRSLWLCASAHFLSFSSHPRLSRLVWHVLSLIKRLSTWSPEVHH